MHALLSNLLKLIGIIIQSLCPSKSHVTCSSKGKTHHAAIVVLPSDSFFKHINSERNHCWHLIWVHKTFPIATLSFLTYIKYRKLT